MEILITGGTGFIGCLLMAECQEHQFTVVSRDPIKASTSLSSYDNVAHCVSLADVVDLNHFDAVINLAGEPIIDKRWTEQQKANIQSSRWDTTSHLVECFKQSSSPPKVFLTGSAIGYYGEQGDTALSETSPVTANDFSANLCREWEQRAQPIADQCRLVYLRTGIVLHPKFGALQRMILPFKMGLGGPIGNGRHYFSWIHWQDMISAIKHLLINEQAAGPFNMTAPKPVRNKEFSKALGRALHRPAFFPVPPFMLKIMLGESAELLMVSQRVLPTALAESGYKFAYTEIDDCLENLVGNG